MSPTDHHRDELAIAGRLAVHLDELRRVRHRVEDDHELGRKLKRQECLLAWFKLDHLQNRAGKPVLHVFGQLHAGTEEDLSVVFERGQSIGIMSRDAAHARADSEGYLDHLVEGRFISGSAQGAVVLLPVYRLEGGAGIQYS